MEFSGSKKLRRNTAIHLGHKPSSYREMDEWLNALSRSAWTAIVGEYAAGGISNVVTYLKSTYPENTSLWAEKDLRHYFNCRRWSGFKPRGERP